MRVTNNKWLTGHLRFQQQTDEGTSRMGLKKCVCILHPSPPRSCHCRWKHSTLRTSRGMQIPGVRTAADLIGGLLWFILVLSETVLDIIKTASPQSIHTCDFLLIAPLPPLLTNAPALSIVCLPFQIEHAHALHCHELDWTQHLFISLVH